MPFRRAELRDGRPHFKRPPQNNPSKKWKPLSCFVYISPVDGVENALGAEQYAGVTGRDPLSQISGTVYVDNDQGPLVSLTRGATFTP
jgi:hypothetical protein